MVVIESLPETRIWKYLQWLELNQEQASIVDFYF